MTDDDNPLYIRLLVFLLTIGVLASLGTPIYAHVSMAPWRYVFMAWSSTATFASMLCADICVRNWLWIRREQYGGPTDRSIAEQNMWGTGVASVFLLPFPWSLRQAGSAPAAAT